MEKRSKSEKIILERTNKQAIKLQQSIKGLPIGWFVRSIRTQLGMSQRILSERANVPQSTISKVERTDNPPTFSTLTKILIALNCDLLIAPVLKDSIDITRQKQAKKKTLAKIQYLRGTMNLEKQKPNNKLIEELIKQEEDNLLHASGSKLWKK